MAGEQSRILMERGIQAIRAGQKDEARRLLQQALRLDSNNDTAWLLLGSIADNKRDKLLCIKKALEINPENQTAIKAVRAMGIEPEQLFRVSSDQPPAPPAVQRRTQDAPPTPPAPIPPPAPVDPYADGPYTDDYQPQYEEEYEEDSYQEEAPPQPISYEPDVPEEDFDTFEEEEAAPAGDGSGVPISTPRRIRDAQALAEQIIAGYTAPPEDPFTWVRKKRGRAGEREVWILRFQVTVAMLVFFGIVGGIAAYAISNSPQVQLTLFGASPTPVPPTRTPTNTPTNTPGFTPTPSPTRDFTQEPTFTPSPTIFPSITPGRIEITPIATALQLPEQPDSAVRTAVALLKIDEPEGAIPPLATSRAQQGQTFNPNPYYFEALALLQMGNIEGATSILNDATAKLDPNAGFVNLTTSNAYRPLVELGYAQINLKLAQDALEVSNRTAANEYLREARTRAETALATDATLADAYLLIAETYRLSGDYEEAITTITEAQVFPELVTNLNLIVAKGRAYLQQGYAIQASDNQAGAQESFQKAAYEGYYAVLLNPFSEPAHQLKIETALALGDPGLAVIYSQGYLLYFPQSAEAFRRLGNARLAEGNIDLALETYGRALQAEGTDSVIADVLTSRAALYSQQRRYDLALQDLNDAFEREFSLTTQSLRMQAAYDAKDYETVNADANALIGTGILPDSQINLLKARVLVEEAQGTDTERLADARTLLSLIGSDLPAPLVPVADEYRARTNFALNDLEGALAAINSSLTVVETGSRHYLRGQIYEAQDDRPNAIAEYQWILTWTQVFNYPFADDANQRLTDIQKRTADEFATATSTAVTATAAAEYATATAAAPITVTAEFRETITATAGVALTGTADARATVTATAGLALTATIDARATATATAGLALTATIDARATATAGAALVTQTLQAQQTSTAERATNEVIAATAVLDTATAAAQGIRLTATAAAQPTVTPRPSATPSGG